MTAPVVAMLPIDPVLAKNVPEGPWAALKRLNVDIASTANPIAMAAVRAMLPDEQIFYGTDFPWRAPIAPSRRSIN